MHFDILVEDQSGKKMLDILVPMVIGNNHTYKVHSYKGVGRIPKNLTHYKNARTQSLLDKLPRLLRGYGQTHAVYPDDYPAAVIVVCDLDDKCLKTFRQQLLDILCNDNPQPKTRFCIAIEEGEAWFLGDIPAIKAAFPKADDSVLGRYENDSICGTWECLANAVYPGGATKLIGEGWQRVGAEKSQWAEKISPHMKIEHNASTSFIYFRDTLRALANAV